MSEIFESRDALLEWITGPGLRLVLIAIAAVVAVAASRRLIGAAVHPRLLGPDLRIEPDEMERRERRERTVESFLRRTAAVFIALSAVLIMLSELGVSVAPLIASAGIVGIAIGFGAQTLVRDAIAGVFLLLENHYDIGDRVRLNNVEGRVVGLSLRRTTIEGDDGAVHTIPNGAISVTTNLRGVSAGGRGAQ